MNADLFQEALRNIQERRYRAVTENERRYAEINRKIPDIVGTNQSLAQTSMKIFHILQEGKDVAEQLEEIKRNNLAAQRFSERLLAENGYPENYLDIHYTCEKCQDTGFYQGTYCDCLRAEMASLSIQKMNRNAQIQLCSFEQFSLDYYKGKTTKDGKDCYTVMKHVWEYCIHYARTFSTSSPSLLFYGRTGLGKTHLSLAIAKSVIEQGGEVLYDSIINFVDKVSREQFGRSNPEVETMPLLLNVDLLILDDLGTEFDTSLNVSTIYNIINTRINKGLPTIINTNLNHYALAENYEERIVSRLFAVYKSFEFVGEDIRLLKRDFPQK